MLKPSTPILADDEVRKNTFPTELESVDEPVVSVLSTLNGAVGLDVGCFVGYCGAEGFGVNWLALFSTRVKIIFLSAGYTRSLTHLRRGWSRTGCRRRQCGMIGWTN